MPNFQTLLESSPLPDLRLRRRAAELVQSMVRGQSSNSLGCLSPADRTQESFTRGAYRFFDNDDVTRTALHMPMQEALRELISPSESASVAHDLSVLNYSGHNRKEDLIPVGNDRTWGYELFQSLVIKFGVPVGAAVTELRNTQGILSSEQDEAIPFIDHLEQAERAVDSVEKLLPERLLTHLFDREFDDVKLLRHLAERRYVMRCRMLSRIVAVHGEKQSIGKHLESLELHHSAEGNTPPRAEYADLLFVGWRDASNADQTVAARRSEAETEATARSPAARARGGVRAATARCKTTPLGPPNQPHRVRTFRRGTLPGALEN